MDQISVINILYWVKKNFKVSEVKEYVLQI